MKPKLLLAAAAVVVFASGASHAGMFDLSFNNEAFNVWAGFNLGKDEEAQFMLGGRYLYSDEEDSKIPAVLAAFSSKPSANEAVDFSVGMQVYFGESKNQNVEGVALGGMGTWAPEGWKGAYVGARLFYAPEVFCFGATEGTFEWEVQGGYKFNPKIRIFVEYGGFDADVENVGNVTIDESWKFGFGARF